MSPSVSIDLLHRAVLLCLLAAAPLLLTALVIGVLISMVQAVTQIQEQTLTFIPKLIGVALVLMLSLPWMLRLLVQYVVEAFRGLSVMI
jgi:flagellar biosynthetic protein FliQ